MAKEDGFLGLFQKLESDPTTVMLSREQIDALRNKLHDTPFTWLLPRDIRAWRGRMFLQLGGAAPTFRMIEKISSQPKQGRPLAYDAVFAFDGSLVSENYPTITSIQEEELKKIPKSLADAASILGIATDAPRDQVEHAFHALAKKYHPSVAGNTVDANNKMAAINAAYEIFKKHFQTQKETAFTNAGNTLMQNTKSQNISATNNKQRG